MNLISYPLDTQICKFELGSTTQTMDEVTYLLQVSYSYEGQHPTAYEVK